MTTRDRRILIFLLFIHVFSNTKSQYLDNVDVISAINLQPTPVLEPGKETDVATVLLVDNNDRAPHGRFLNVKPSVGLITSTARTFIQEGITTEYATQVVGTTLDNGRLYAQLLSKSTRVLYDNNDNRKSAYMNEVLPQRNNWRLDDDLLLQSTGSFIKNTDDYGQNNAAFLVYPSQTIYNNIPVYEEYTYNSEVSNVNSANNNNNNNNNNNYNNENDQIVSVQDNKIIKPNKIQAENTLPTFTVKNEFAPSGISYNGQVSNSGGNQAVLAPQVHVEKSTRFGKNYVQAENNVIRIQPLPEVKSLTSITYYGFADFTTVVGDTVIIFSPSTVNSLQNTHITSITGEATLNGDHKMIKATTIERNEIKPTTVKFSNDIVNNRINTEINEHYNVQSNFILEGDHDDTDYDTITIKLPETTTSEPQHETEAQSEPGSTQEIELETERQEEQEEDEEEDEDEVADDDENATEREQKPSVTEATTPLMVPEVEEKIVEEIVNQINTPDILIEPSETQAVSTPMLSTPSNEDISKIFASLASVKAQQELEKKQMTESTQEIDPHPHETQVLGGVTTIFFEDDPFAQFDQPSQMESNTERQEKQKQFEPEITTEQLPEQTTVVENETETTIGEDEMTTMTEAIDEEDTTLPITTESVVDTTTPQQKLKLCEGPLKLIPSTVYKTLTFLTTFFIPIEDENGVESISTSVKTDRMETSDIAYNLPTDCTYDIIKPTNIQLLGNQATTTTIPELIPKAMIENETDQTSALPPTTIMMMSVESSTSSSTENKETTNVDETEDETQDVQDTTEISPTTTEKNDDAEIGNNEIELIYKTLYTTYTYLTTFFHDTTSSISSRKEVVTNIVSSTLNSLLLKTDDAVANLVSGMSDSPVHDIKPTAAVYNGDGAATITNNFIINENDLAGIDNIIHDKDKIDRPTPVLNDITEQTNIRTYYTTYTYFTTIFVDGETEISSRTEVYTNYVNVEPTKHEIDNNLIPKYSTMLRNTGGDQNEEEADEVVRMITDVKSSSSDGDRSYIEEELDDQLSSESNREETMPEPSLLLLQTSYTTFTFFTTMYIGSTSSNVLSRLETITNVVTEKIKPTETIDLLNTANSDSIDLPITYFTTFTYWTTLFKDNQTITTSREETISNVVEPTSVVQENIVTTQVTQLLETAKPNVIIETSQETSDTEPNTAQNVDLTQTLGVNIDPTTYYTTYTYFTTSYIGDETVLNSRFETFTNIVTPTVINGTQGEGRAIKVDSNVNNQILDSAIIKPSKPIVNVTEISNRFDTNDSTSDLVSINYGKIIDADGVSTLYYTTKAFGTLINNELSQIIESTSSLNIDEQKKSLLAEIASQNNETATVAGNKNHKTGLVRSIDGTIISNRTTTLYQSKIIGTNIDGRYAQIIVSTTSFLIEKTPSPVQGLNADIKPTAVVDNSEDISPSTILVTTPSALEPSTEINGGDGGDEGFEDENEDSGEDEEDEDGDDDGTNRKKSRLTFQTRKRTFTPVIRPFASRNRPTFNPKRKNVNPTAATIISRSDFTPTITATPALKNEQSRGRFSVNRNSNRNSLSSTNNIQQTADPGLGGNRRFVRPRVTATGNNNISPSGSYNGGGGSGSTRLRSTNGGGNRIQPTPTANFGGSSRRGGLRGSSSIQPNRPAIGGSGSSLYSGNARFNRIRPSSVNQFDRNALSTGFLPVNTTPNPNETDDDFLTTFVTEDPTDFTSDEPNNFDTPTTESLRRNQNPLLRFRRPKIGGGSSNNSPNGFSTTTTRPLITTRKSALLGRNRNNNKVSAATTTTTTTSRPRVNNLFQRPTNLIGLQNRNKPANNLFPARGVANRQPVQNKDDDLQNGDNLPDDDDNIENEHDNDDTYYDASEEDEDIIKTRKKRQVEYGKRSSNFSPRFRRPTTSRNKVVEEVVEDKSIDEPPPTPKLKTSSNRYSLSARSRNQGNSNQASVTPRIRPTSASNSNSRPQFTLREKDVSLPTKSSNFRRPTTSTRRKPTSVTTTRPKNNNNNNNNNNNGGNSRLRGYSSTEPAARTSNPRARTTVSSRGRSNSTPNNNFSRSRPRAGQQDFEVSYVQPSFDGTIVITHHIPTEVTIPVVNGKNTEYKNIVTAKISTETIGPQQYSTSIRENGVSVLVLANDVTGVNANGATEITQFILNETPTTSVIFTPTTIRGRKTSYSHIIPSTIFDVDRVVTTIQPQIAANAPLANILLSQLLLGNLNQNINPLLALQQQQQQQQIPATPTTELKTKTTTYVTTVTNSISTILPLTFRGKEILTTIVDTSVEVITATEFITETVIVQPTLQPQNQQLNSLLLPLLLQQQQQVQPQALQQPQQQQLRQQTSPQQSLLDVLSFEADYNYDDALKLNLGIGDGARHNLATRVMSNGVEVIVAGDKSTLPGNAFRILSNGVYKNHMLAPTTLKDHMMLMVPFGNDQNDTNIELASSFLYPNQFVTKTCLTTFTYLKTYIVQGESRVESHEKVISNIATEEKNYVTVQPTPVSQILLSKVPNLAVGILHTTYTYLNTVHDDIPVVITSKHTVTNTITAPDDYLSLLQPSEYATPVTDVNTYYNTIELTKTLSDSHITKQITTKETVTQVIITESLPQNHIVPLQATVHQGFDDTAAAIKTNDIFKTYFVTYTYYNTFLEKDNRTIIRTNISTTSQVSTEKLYLYPTAAQNDIYKTSAGDQNLHLYGTKTYFTKFTFFTTLSDPNGIHGSTIVTSNTRVIENVITESIAMDRLDDEVGNQIRKQLMTRDGFVTAVRLRDGESINVTAVNFIVSTKVNQITNTDKILEASPSPIVAHGHDDNTEEASSIEQSDSISSNEAADDEDNAADGSEVLGVIAKPASENVSNLINSLRLPSLPSLNALGPMINAMAGLIQNFGRRNSSSNQAPIALPLTQHFNEGPNHGPIYIPVNGIAPSEGIHNELLHINKFGPIAEKWVNEEDQRKKVEIVIGKPTHEASLVNGGIPISPGDVITANSDVIIGKPAVIGPRVPMGLNSNLQPPPLPSPSQHTSSKGIPFIRNQNSYSNQNPISFPIRNIINSQSPPLPPPSPPSQSRPSYEDDKLSIIGSNGGLFHSNIMIPNEIFNHNRDEIIEIRKIPEVFSTDLPAIHVNNYHPMPQIQQQPLRYLVSQASQPQPLLVDLQPSQLANVLIPHGSTTGIIFGGKNEPLTNGKYFDAPLPYADVAFNTNKPILEHSDSPGPGYEHHGGNIANVQPSHAIQMKIPKNSNGINVNVSPLPIINQITSKPRYPPHYYETNRIYYPPSQPQYNSQPKPLQPIQITVKNINENFDSMMAETKFSTNLASHSTSTQDEGIDIESDYDGEDGAAAQETITNTLRPVKPIILTTTPAPEITTLLHNPYNTSHMTMMVPQMKPVYTPNIPFQKLNHFVRPNYNQRPPYSNNHPQMMNNMRPPPPQRHAIKPRPLPPPPPPPQFTPQFYDPIKPPHQIVGQQQKQQQQKQQQQQQKQQQQQQQQQQQHQHNQHKLIALLQQEQMDNQHKLIDTSTTTPTNQVSHPTGFSRGKVVDYISEMTLNIGEMTTEKYNNASLNHVIPLDYHHNPSTHSQSHFDNDLSEIFDFKETINPHYGIALNEYDTTRIEEPSDKMRPPPLPSTVMMPPLRPVISDRIPEVFSEQTTTFVPEIITTTTEVLTSPKTTGWYKKTTLNARRTTPAPMWTTITKKLTTPKTTTNSSPTTIRTTTNVINSTTTSTTTPTTPKTTTPAHSTTSEKSIKLNKKPTIPTILYVSPRTTSTTERPPANKNVTQSPPPRSSPLPPSPPPLPPVFQPLPQPQNKTIEFEILSATAVILTKPSNSKDNQMIFKSSFDNSVISISLKHQPSIEYSTNNYSPDIITDYDVTDEDDNKLNLIIGSETSIPFLNNGMDVSIRVGTEAMPTPIFISATKLNRDTTVFNNLFNTEPVSETTRNHKRTSISKLRTILTRTKTIIDTVVKIHTVDVTPVLPTTTPYDYTNFPDLYNHTNSSEQIDDDILDSYVISYNEKTSTTTSTSQPNDHPINNDSIYVVMTDKRKPGVKSNEPPAIFNSSIDYIENSIDYDELIASRDEDDHTNEVNRVLLGGILIASPPHHDLVIEMSNGHDCKPECKPSRNEICQKILHTQRCICRPGFARMFPDRPCKPTYTYTINLAVTRKGKERLMYVQELSDVNSATYKNLTEIAHEGIDRMVMQSDFRDIYHGIHITGFNKMNDTSERVVIEFYLQLSDNTDEKRLVDIFNKYLRSNNNSLGGTDLYADSGINDELKAFDFNECTNTDFNDCSPNAHCFNLRGTYTCSCREGFVDLSENSIYPGRICNTVLIGCEKCNYHGSCLTTNENDQYCECFQWYTGQNCHINLKILLIVLITIGVILLTLLVICIRVTCIKKRRCQTHNNLFLVSGKRIIAGQVNSRRRSSGHSKLDKKSMIDDDFNSETSNESNTLPYVSSMKSKKVKYQTESKVGDSMVAGGHASNEQSDSNFYHSDKNDKIMTVMIPRAKYHSTIQGASLINMESFDRGGGGGGGASSVCSTTEAKLLSYLDSSPTTANITSKRKPSGCANKIQNTHQAMPSGALVSAGFEVSATVGYESENDHKNMMVGTLNSHHDENDDFKIITATEQLIAPSHKYTAQSLNLGIDSIVEDDESHFMMLKQTHSTVSEARSYDETTIKPPTKSLHSLYDKRSSHLLNDEANTMAERDLGSTFLLPHTHLYKPDRGSDISGFDSL